MRLKKLEINGFKSFADKVILDFPDGITAVVGPNGSGKSNVLDSVLWVLGEQSAKALRGSKMEDIIFAGTAERKPSGYAEVSITIDNQDKKMPIEFSEVTVTRRLYRSGESQFLINKSACRLKDIHELFMDTGLGKDGYSIIGQGKIDEIINSKSDSRRAIFEEAAGIIKFRSRKEETEQKLEATNANLVRVNDIIYGLEEQLEPLCRQSEEAQSYLKIREELKNLEIGMYLGEVDKLNNDIEKVKIKQAECEKNISMYEENITELKKNKEEYEKNREEIFKQIEGKNEDKSYFETEYEKILGKKNVIAEKITTCNEGIKRNNEYLKDLNSRLLEYEQKKQQILNEIETGKINLEKKNCILEEKQDKFLSLNKKTKDVESLIETYKSDIIDLLGDISEKNTTINTIKALKQNIKSMIDKLHLQKNEYKNNINELEINKNQYINQKNELSALDEEIEVFMKENNKTKILLQERFSKEQQEFDKNSIEIRTLKSKISMLLEMEREFEGYNKSVKALLKQCEHDKGLAIGVDGVLARLIKVPKKYEAAIEVALGAALQNIVTDNEEVAKKLIEYLKRNNLGRATFLPISTVRERKLDGAIFTKVKSCKGFVGIASDIVEADKKHSEIISNLLGKVIVANNLDDAFKIAKETNHTLKIVTLDGDILNIGGSITGGSTNQRTAHVLSRKREIDEHTTTVENKSKDNETLEKSINDIKYKISEIDKSIINMTNKSQETKINLNKNANLLEQSIKEIERLNERFEVLENEEKQVLEQEKDSDISLKNQESELEFLIKNRTELEEKIKKEQGSIEEEKAFIESELSVINELKIEISKLNQDIKNMYEKDKDNDVIISSVNKEIYSRNCENEQYEKNIKVYESELLDLDKEILKSNNEKAKILEEIKELHNNAGNIKTELEEKEKVIQNLNLESEKSKNDFYKFEANIAKFQTEIEAFHNNIWEKYNITYANAEKYRLKAEIKNIKSQIQTLRSEIKKFGEINIGAIEEYKRVKEKYEFLSSQKADLEAAIKSLNEVIDDVILNMQKQFIEKFELIKKNFQKVFVALFGGGRADLVLTDSQNILESGVDIIVEPPGKKLQNINLLSGGEKALTAISLLFGIFEVKVSPFCILDEIEAALDDANVYRFAEYLDGFSNQTQFLVITHRKGTMEHAHNLYGVSMEEKGVSKIVSLKLENK